MHNDLELIKRFLEQEVTARETANTLKFKSISEAREALRAIDRVIAMLAMGAGQ